MKVNYNKFFVALGVATLMTACSSKDLYDAETVERQVKADYAENFAKAYPGVNMNQDWDYSSKLGVYRLGAPSTRAVTRAGVGTISAGDWYEVEDATLAWMKNKLVEKNNNRSLGNPFYMTVPSNSFTIVPIYQGASGAQWDLHVVVDGEDYKVWSKSENIQYKKLAWDAEWTDLNDISTIESGRNTMWVAKTRSRGITITGMPTGADMYFYLKITKAALGGYHEQNAEQSSLNQMMLALQDVPRPTNIPEEKEVMVVGCEDADLSLSDWDMNDVVLLVYGNNKVPKPIEITDEPVEEVTTVRYMIEDLGATDDFDFNDIVLDVSNIVNKTAVYENGKFLEWKDVFVRQEAVIRHLGGTLPFQLTVGNTVLEERAGVLGADPDETFEVTGWDMNRHNISVNVRQNVNENVYNNVRFPKSGEAPMIIAVDPSQPWMGERESVPETWFTIPEE